MALLWGPLGLLIYVLLSRTISDPLVRLALSCAGTYTLTTLLYFGTAVLRVEWLFGASLLGATVTAILLWRRITKTARISLPRIDSVLLAIVAGSLVTTIAYSPTLPLQRSGDRGILEYPDQLYHVGLEYELSRHVPPSQASIRAGTPERAYHLFPHLTVMLISRFTGQQDMFRAHAVYFYATITTLICLTLYGIGFLLTNGRTGGYACAFLPFLFAIAMKPIIPNKIGYFYFTLLPQASSTVYPTLWTSPQMFSGVAAMFSVLLGVAAIVRVCRTGRNDYVLPILCGLMTASLLRFRVHCWLTAFPAFLVLAAWMWYRSRHMAWIISAGVTAVVSVLLYTEMSLSVYMRGTTEFHFALSSLSKIPFYQVWPGSLLCQKVLHYCFSGVLYNWAWHIACLTGFAILDIIGIPLLLVILLVPAIFKRHQVLNYYLFTIGLLLLSMLLAACWTMGYDQYSVPGQLLYHFGWYTLPLEGVGVAWLISKVQRRFRYAWVLWLVIAITSGVTSFTTARKALPGLNNSLGIITPAAWDGFRYLKDWTPDNAVVLSSSPWDRELFMVSGLSGRGGYQEGGPNPVNDQALRLNPTDNRVLILSQMGAAHAAGDRAKLCSVLTGTPITHVLERAANALMPDLPCLQKLWTARDGVTAVWRVRR